MDSTVLAEPVFGGLVSKLVKRERVLAGDQLEPLGWNAMMQYPFLGTNRAVAFYRFIEIGNHLKLHPPAMAAPLIRFHVPSAWP